MSYIDINKVKEKALYRVIKEVELHGRSIINTDTRIGQIITRKIRMDPQEEKSSVPDLIISSNRFKNITTVITPIDVDVKEIIYRGRNLSRFRFKKNNGGQQE